MSEGLQLIKAYLLEPPKMIKRECHHQLLEDVVSTKLKIDVLLISRLLLVQRQLKKELKSLMDVLARVAILLDRNWHIASTGSGKCLWSFFFQAVLCCPWSTFSNSVKGSIQVRLPRSAPLLNLGIVLLMVNSIEYLPLSFWISTRLLFWGLLLCSRSFGQCLVVIPWLNHLVERWTFVDGSHHITLVALCA